MLGYSFSEVGTAQLKPATLQLADYRLGSGVADWLPKPKMLRSCEL